MPQMIKRGKELIRINAEHPNRIEYSTTDGRSWNRRCTSSYINEFKDLIDNGKEIFTSTDKGLFYSTTEGNSWNKRS